MGGANLGRRKVDKLAVLRRVSEGELKCVGVAYRHRKTSAGERMTKDPEDA